MTNMLCESAFFGVVISLLAYELGMLLKKKFGLPIFNPLLISIAVVIVFLAVFDIDYQNYNDGAKYLSYLLTPATVCLAIPLYEQMEALKKNIKAILAGILSGVLTSLTVVLVLALIFNLNHKMYVTLLPKSITTAIGMGVSEELGGAVTITVAVIIITGVLGNMLAETLCKLFHIERKGRTVFRTGNIKIIVYCLVCRTVLYKSGSRCLGRKSFRCQKQCRQLF